MAGRNIPDWVQDQIHTDRIAREEHIARTWTRNYEAHVAAERETEAERAKLRAAAEATDVELQRRRRRSRFTHQSFRYFTTGTKGRVSGYAGHTPGQKHVLGVQGGEYADHRYAGSFDEFGHVRAGTAELTALELEAAAARAGPGGSAVADALPHQLQVTSEFTQEDTAGSSVVADSLDDEQRARLASTLAYVVAHKTAKYGGFVPGSSSVVGL